MAEHGFSALVTVERDGRRSSVLYDGGMTPGGLANNLAVMEVDPAGLRPSSSPTATSTTTAAWRAWPPGPAAACPC